GMDTPKAGDFARDWIAKNPEGAACAVLIFDGRIRMGEGKCDAGVAEADQLSPEARAFTLAVPYRPYATPDGFGVPRPKFPSDEPEGTTFDDLAAAFFRGVDQHKEGSAVWNKHLDESR